MSKQGGVASQASAVAALAANQATIRSRLTPTASITLNDILKQFLDLTRVQTAVNEAEAATSRAETELSERLDARRARVLQPRTGGVAGPAVPAAAAVVPASNVLPVPVRKWKVAGDEDKVKSQTLSSSALEFVSAPPSVRSNSPAASTPDLRASPSSSTTTAATSTATTAAFPSTLPVPPVASSASQRRVALAARRANLARLSSKLARETSEVHTLRAAVLQKRESLLPKVSLIQQLHATALEHRERLASEHKVLRVDLRVRLHLLQLRCDSRRRTLLQNLASIYPISPPRTALKSAQTHHPLMCFTIRGLRLPNNFNNILTSFDEEQVSTALGYVCHLLLIISKYLEVPLRYRMIYRASRSVICDDVTASSQFPLYFRNMEERRFELGVILLGKNIEHVRETGDNAHPSRATQTHSHRRC